MKYTVEHDYVVIPPGPIYYPVRTAARMGLATFFSSSVVMLLIVPPLIENVLAVFDQEFPFEWYFWLLGAVVVITLVNVVLSLFFSLPFSNRALRDIIPVLALPYTLVVSRDGRITVDDENHPHPELTTEGES